MPSAAASYKQKHLNLWVNATAPCLSVEGWRKGQTATPTEADKARWRDELLHESCFASLDLASKIDLACLSLNFPPAPGRLKRRLLQFIWTPEETLKDRAHRDRAPYPVWVEQGWLLTTPGTRIDQRIVLEQILALKGMYDIERIGFDPWHVDKLVDDLKAEGFAEEQLIEVPQTFAGMSSACLRMQAEILAGEVDAGGCPVTAWAVSNVVGQKDGKDNLMFVKKKSRGRIDPVIAATIGTALDLREPRAVDTSVMAEWL
jgi:phage terminase large subunit-like protein